MKNCNASWNRSKSIVSRLSCSVPERSFVVFRTSFWSSILPSILDDDSLQNESHRHGRRIARSLSYVRSIQQWLHQVDPRPSTRSDHLCYASFSIDDLWRVMQNLGENPSKHDIEDMMREADRDGDGKINFAEFVEMVRLSRAASEQNGTIIIQFIWGIDRQNDERSSVR